MNYLSLFSGIGGFELGMYRAGIRCENHFFSEVDKYAENVYRRRFPEAVALGCITKIEGKKLPKGEWLITGGSLIPQITELLFLMPCFDIYRTQKL